MLKKGERLTSQSVLTKVSGRARRTGLMGDSLSGVFELILGNCIISQIQNCTNVEARRVLLNNDRHASKNGLRAFIALLYVRGVCGGKKFRFTISGISNEVCFFYQKPWQEMVFEKYFDFPSNIHQDARKRPICLGFKSAV